MMQHAGEGRHAGCDDTHLNLDKTVRRKLSVKRQVKKGPWSGEDIHHDLQIEQIPSFVFRISVDVAEVDAHCGGYNGPA